MVASENFTSASETRIAVLGLSTSNELYFLEGRRTLNAAGEPTVSFPIASGFPIRKGVGHISPMLNSIAASTEILYTSDTGDNCIFHLTRDPHTSLWSETSLRTTVTERTADPAHSSKGISNNGIQYHAYVTNITFKDRDDDPVPENYAVQLSCEAPIFVTINGRSYNLGVRPQEVLTRSNGQVEIIMRAHGLLGCPRYLLSMTEACTEAEKAKVYNIQPAQRVIRQLGQIRSASDLKNARQTDGRAVFALDTASDQDFESMAGMLKQFPDMMNSVSSGIENEVGAVPEATDFVIDQNGNLVKYQSKVSNEEEPSGFEKASNIIAEAIGDVIEFLGKGFKSILRVVVRVMGPVVKLYLKLQDVVVKFVIKTTVSLLRIVSHFLKETFGLDMSKLCGFLGFLFDIDSIKSIQNVSLLPSSRYR